MPLSHPPQTRQWGRPQPTNRPRAGPQTHQHVPCPEPQWGARDQAGIGEKELTTAADTGPARGPDAPATGTQHLEAQRDTGTPWPQGPAPGTGTRMLHPWPCLR